MQCQPWMDRTPEPKKTPLQQAQDDMHHWKREMEAAERRLAECRKEFGAAVDRVCRADKR